MSLANISIVGNLAREPERHVFDNQRFKTTLIVAVNSFNSVRKEKTTDFYRVETWDRLANLAQNYLKKGNQVTVSGKLAFQKWVDREGKDRITPIVQANQLALPPRSKPDPVTPTPQPQPTYAPKPVFPESENSIVDPMSVDPDDLYEIVEHPDSEESDELVSDESDETDSEESDDEPEEEDDDEEVDEEDVADIEEAARSKPAEEPTLQVIQNPEKATPIAGKISA